MRLLHWKEKESRAGQMCFSLCLAKVLQFIVTNREIAAKFFRSRALPSLQTGADDEEIDIDGCLLYWYGILAFLFYYKRCLCDG